MTRLRVERYGYNGAAAYGCALGWLGWVSLWPTRWGCEWVSNEWFWHVRIGPLMWTRAWRR